MHPRESKHGARSLAVAAACVLMIGLLVGCGDSTASARPTSTGRQPTAAPTPESTETPAAITFEPEPSDLDTGSPGTPPCGIDSLKASRGITEVDGDDRTTEVVLVAADTCSIDAFPALVLEDGKGNIIVAASPAGTGGIDLVGGVAYSTEITTGNWCGSEPDYPVRIGILEGSKTLLVTGDSFPDEGDLPACLHQDADPTLSATAWAPKS